jgi:hypothetical protein
MEQQNNLFGIADYIPQPKPKTRSVCGCFISECNCQKQKAIENHFKAGKELTVLDAVKLFRTIDLRKYISTLRKRGMNITSVWVVKPGVKYKIYKLSKEVKL